MNIKLNTPVLRATWGQIYKAMDVTAYNSAKKTNNLYELSRKDFSKQFLQSCHVKGDILPNSGGKLTQAAKDKVRKNLNLFELPEKATLGQYIQKLKKFMI